MEREEAEKIVMLDYTDVIQDGILYGWYGMAKGTGEKHIETNERIDDATILNGDTITIDGISVASDTVTIDAGGFLTIETVQKYLETNKTVEWKDIGSIKAGGAYQIGDGTVEKAREMMIEMLIEHEMKVG